MNPKGDKICVEAIRRIMHIFSGKGHGFSKCIFRNEKMGREMVVNLLQKTRGTIYV